MAKIERFPGGNVINLTASVGRDGINLKEDVLVVQAMLKYAPEKRGVFGKVKLPEPNGVMNQFWIDIIKDYQRYLRRKQNAKVAVDGKIDRAVGETVFGKRTRWTILCLNGELLEIRLLDGGADNEFRDLCRQFPQLNGILETPIGSLDLTLEGGSGVGSLNLGLE
jgi:hypothetical protein